MKKSVFVYQVVSVCEVVVDSEKFPSALDKRKEAIRIAEIENAPFDYSHERLIALTFDAEKEVTGIMPVPNSKIKIHKKTEKKQ
ncbi:hypothetical protein KAR91_32355 [Candidatus Pacearchaeota archaeon]|nr:hypothetical protein [Candidatus Pacearchaeota archaeon]